MVVCAKPSCEGRQVLRQLHGEEAAATESEAIEKSLNGKVISRERLSWNSLTIFALHLGDWTADRDSPAGHWDQCYLLLCDIHL